MLYSSDAIADGKPDRSRETMNSDLAPEGYIGHLHAFRGFAIVTIVAAHSWSMFLTLEGFRTMPSEQAVYAVTETLFHGSTFYFALISGLLFSRVLRPRGWTAFYRSKAVNVLSPYVFVSSVFAIAFWPFYVEWAEAAGESTNFFVVFPLALLRGNIQLQFWYIPVLFGLFALTPLFDAAVRNRRAIWFAGLIVIVPLVVSRTIMPQLLSIPTFVYFAGAYVAGMLVGEFYEGARHAFARFLVPLWVAAIGCSLVICLLYLNEYDAPGLTSISESLFYVQKLAISALVLHYFANQETRLPRWLHVLGTYAFAIYFLHFFFAYGSGQAIYHAGARHYVNAYTASAAGFAILLIAIGMSLLVSWGLRKLLRGKSRLFIGV